MANKAQEIIIPTAGIFRIVFLYVGQGTSTLLVVPDKDSHKYVLIDCNLDKEREGINVVKMLKDLLSSSKLDVFINTHPHNDHLCGLKEIYDEIGISEIWHSGHTPSKTHQDKYKILKDIMKKMGDSNVYQLLGSTIENKLDKKDYILGDISYNVLSPAEYVCDDIEDEEAEKRDRRIHEQCGVIRFSYGEDPARILITGDSDLCAWKEHITDYHKDRIPANVLSASHHGSRTFFKNNEEDEPYLEHLDTIDPTYLIISAPKQSNSPHGHPHDDALELYEDKIDDDKLFHLGDYDDKRICVIVDIDENGNIDVNTDENIWNAYKFSDNDDNRDMKKEAGPFIWTSPKQTGDLTPRKYGFK